MRRTFKTFALAGIAALAMAVSTAIPAQAAPRLNASTYVALGDSYSSGALLGGNLDQTCDRSSAAYPVVLAGGTNFVSFKACSGATIQDTVALLPTVPQRNVKVVTLTVGFNDTHWAAAVKALLSRDRQFARRLLSSTAEITTATGRVAQNIPGLISALRTANPKATIYWGGYVQQFGAAEISEDSCTFAYSTPDGTAYTTSISILLANSLYSIFLLMNGVIQVVFLAALN